MLSYKAENLPLNVVLTKVAEKTNMRFAFDDDYFSTIIVTINVKDVTVDDFLKQLSNKYPIDYKLIGSTWVIFKKDKIAIVKSKPPAEEKEKPKFEINEEASAPVIVPRLWNFEGVVTDLRTGNRLPDCRVYVDEYRQPLTNTIGFFSDEVVSPRNVHVKVNRWGYYPLDTLLQMTDSAYIHFKLIPMSEDRIGHGVFVVISRQVEWLLLNDDAGANPGGKEITDYSNYFNYLAGITTEINDGILIRGESPVLGSIRVDNVPVFNQSHLYGQVSAINSDFIHHSSILKGGLSSSELQNSSGIIDLVGKAALEKPSVNLTATLLDASLWLGLPFSDKLSLSAAIRKSNTEYWPNFYYKQLTTSSFDVVPYDERIVATPEVSSFSSYYDINAKLTYNPDVRNEINLVFIGSGDRQETGFANIDSGGHFLNTGSRWNSYSAGLSWRGISSSGWKNSLVASFALLDRIDSDESGGAGFIFGTTADSLLLMQSQVKWESVLSVNKAEHSFGVELNYRQLDYFHTDSIRDVLELSSARYDTLKRENTAGNASLFYQLNYCPLDWLRLSAGIRGSYLTGVDQFYLHPRISADFKVIPQIDLYYKVGQEVLPLYSTNRFDLYAQPYFAWALPTNSEHIRKSWQHILGVTYQNEGALISVEAYRTNVSGQGYYFLNEINNTSEIATASRLRQGVDVEVHYSHQSFSHSLAYSFADVAEDFGRVSLNKDYKRHLLKFNEMVRYHGWMASACLMYGSGKRIRLPDKETNQINQVQLPRVLNADVTVAKRFNAGRITMETGFSLLNVLNNRSVKDERFCSINDGSKNIPVKTIIRNNQFTPSFYMKIKLP